MTEVPKLEAGAPMAAWQVLHRGIGGEWYHYDTLHYRADMTDEKVLRDVARNRHGVMVRREAPIDLPDGAPITLRLMIEAERADGCLWHRFWVDPGLRRALIRANGACERAAQSNESRWRDWAAKHVTR